MATKRLLISLLLALLALCALPALGEAEEEMDEWTVLFYICGADLESKFAYATGNLQEISECSYSPADADAFQDLVRNSIQEDFVIQQSERVNVAIQTGGSTEWHAQELGMDISTTALQRWHFEITDDEATPGTFQLEETLPLANMADPNTLSDFIRWGTAKYPAKKTALVFWGHGGGSKTGLFVDSLFDDDVMYLDELNMALRDGGAHLEVVLFDACMMANLETALAVDDYANWMVASEELVAGKGTAVDAWLQELIDIPECDGETLGRMICDTTQIKYANEDNESTRQLMTWSVIDLSKIQPMADYFDASYAGVREMYLKSPELLAMFTQNAYNTEHYGNGNENMWDLSGVFFRNSHNSLMSGDSRWKVIRSVVDAISYSVRGSGRPAARGLSFCYAVNFQPEELDVYVRNYSGPNYLSLLDAISPWTAPDWVYEQVERLPEMSTLDAYQVKVNKIIYEDGTPAFELVPGYDLNVSSVDYTLYKKNERSGRTISMGTAPAYHDRRSHEKDFYRAYDLWLWPAIDGAYCMVNNQSAPVDGVYNLLYNIPIQMNSEIWILRCAYMYKSDSYELYGLWEGYDSDSTLFNRNVKSLSQVAGQEFRLLYPIQGESEGNAEAYEYSEPLTMYRTLNVEEVNIPEGTYYIQYTLHDLFMRPMSLEPVEVYWDGRKLTAMEPWEGQETLDVMDYYRER